MQICKHSEGKGMLNSAWVSVLCIFLRRRATTTQPCWWAESGCLLMPFPASGSTRISVVPVPRILWALLHLSVMTHHLLPSSSQVTRYPGFPPVAHYCNLWTWCGLLCMCTLAAHSRPASQSPAPVWHPGISCLGITWHGLILFLSQVSFEQAFFKNDRLNPSSFLCP